MESRRPADLKVFIASRESTSDECREDLGTKAWIMLIGAGAGIRR